MSNSYEIIKSNQSFMLAAQWGILFQLYGVLILVSESFEADALFICDDMNELMSLSAHSTETGSLTSVSAIISVSRALDS